MSSPKKHTKTSFPSKASGGLTKSTVARSTAREESSVEPVQNGISSATVAAATQEGTTKHNHVEHAGAKSQIEPTSSSAIATGSTPEPSSSKVESPGGRPLSSEPKGVRRPVTTPLTGISEAIAPGHPIKTPDTVNSNPDSGYPTNPHIDAVPTVFASNSDNTTRQLPLHRTKLPSPAEPTESKATPNPLPVDAPVPSGSKANQLCRPLCLVRHINSGTDKVIGATVPETLSNELLLEIGSKDTESPTYWSLKSEGISESECKIFLFQKPLSQSPRIQFRVKNNRGAAVKLTETIADGLRLTIGPEDNRQIFQLCFSGRDPLISDYYLIRELDVLRHVDSYAYLGALKAGGYDSKNPDAIRLVRIRALRKDHICELTVLWEIEAAASHPGKRYVLASFGDNINDPDRIDTLLIQELTYATLAYQIKDPRWKRPIFFAQSAWCMFSAIEFLHRIGIAHRNVTLRSFFAYAPIESKSFSIRLGNFDEAEMYELEGAAFQSPDAKEKRLPFAPEPFQKDVTAVVGCVVEILKMHSLVENIASEASSTNLSYYERLSAAVTAGRDDQKLLAVLLQTTLNPSKPTRIANVMASAWVEMAGQGLVGKKCSGLASDILTTPAVGGQEEATSTGQTNTSGIVEPQVGRPTAPTSSSPRKRKRAKTTAVRDEDEYVPPAPRRKGKAKSMGNLRNEFKSPGLND